MYLRSVAILTLALVGLQHVPAKAQSPGGCFPENVRWAEPQEGNFGLTYSPSDDLIHLTGSYDISSFDASDGDDVIYIDHIADGASVSTGRGSDTIVICGLSENHVTLYYGNSGRFQQDTNIDKLIVEPAVFRNIPEPFAGQIQLFGHAPGEDQILLKLPPGVEFEFDPPGVSAVARAGNIYFAIMGDGGDRPKRSDFIIERAAEPQSGQAIDIQPRRSDFSSFQCDDTVAHNDGAVRERGDNYVFYRQEATRTAVEAEPGIAIHQFGRGDDIAYLSTSVTVGMGNGADVLLVCQLDEVEALLSMSGGADDLDPDTLILETANLQDVPEGKVRKLTLYGLSPINDRVILRVPEGLEVSFLDEARLGVRVGGLELHLTSPDWRYAYSNGKDIFVVERVAAFGPVEAEQGGPRAELSCDAIPAAEKLSKPQRMYPGDIEMWIHGGDDDRILVDRANGPGFWFFDNGGDDDIYIVDPPESAVVDAGEGADSVIVCSMDELALDVGLQPSSVSSPDFNRDRIVFEPEVFTTVPDGAVRQINVSGFVIGDDQIVLRVPERMDVSVRPSRTGETSDIHVGAQTIIRMRPVKEMSDPAFASSDMTVERKASRSLGAEKPAGPNSQAFDLTCSDDVVAAPFEQTGQIRIYSAEDDSIVTGDDRDIFYYYASDGDDTVHVDGMRQEGYIYLGAGADTAVVCSLGEIDATILTGPGQHGASGHDLQPDTIIFETEALFDVPAGYEREMTVSHVNDLNDRVIFRVPRGFKPRVRRDVGDDLEVIFPATTVNINGSSSDWGHPPSESVIIFQTAGETGSPELPDGKREVAAAERDTDVSDALAAADLTAPSSRWAFDPSIGIEGRASIDGARDIELQVECGNGGAPALWFDPDPRFDRGSDSEPTLDMIVDGTRFPEPFECGDDGSYCASSRFPAIELIDAMRRGSQMTVEHGGARLTAFSLKGSSAAIGRLRGCLSYP